MHCMKCGKEILDDAVFCDDCLTIMKQYPVKTGTPVMLPHRVEAPTTKKVPPRKKGPSMEEKLASSRRINQTLGTALIIVVILLVFTGYFLFEALQSNTEQSHIGQNYNTVAAEDSVR